MAEAFAIFGAVGTSIALLNLARQGFVSLMRTREEFKEAGHRIVDIERRFESTCFNITHWRTFWGLDKVVSTVVLKAFWGEEGCRLIGEHLGAIDIICEDLAAILVPFIVLVSYDQIPEEDRKRAQARLKQPGRRARRGEPHKSVFPKYIQRILGNGIKESAKEREMKKIRVLEERVNKATTVTQKAKFVLSSSARLYGYLQALQDEFEQLQANVGWAWRSQHDSIDYNATTYKQKRILALGKVHGHVLEEAREHREETKILHACCSIREALKLEMDLLRDSTDKSRHRRFNMLVPWPDTYVHLEVCAEILGQDFPLDIRRRKKFLDACEVAESSGHSLFRVLSERENKLLWFSLRKSSAILQPDQYSMHSLSERLRQINTAERLILAYKIVESCLLLLGTSWLSALNSTTLIRIRVRGQDPKYMLGLKDDTSEKSIRKRLEERNLRLELHVFMVGVVLTEIALRTAILDIREPASGLELLITEPEGPKWSSLRRVVSEVKKSIGADYSQTVEFCLQDPIYAPNSKCENDILGDPTRSEEEKSVALLDLFYNNVLIK